MFWLKQNYMYVRMFKNILYGKSVSSVGTVDFKIFYGKILKKTSVLIEIFLYE